MNESPDCGSRTGRTERSCDNIGSVTAISVPTIVGRKGAIQHIEIEMWPKEKAALQKSAGVLRETIDKVLGK